MGNYEAELYGISQENYRLLKEDDRVESAGLLGGTAAYSSFRLEERISTAVVSANSTWGCGAPFTKADGTI